MNPTTIPDAPSDETSGNDSFVWSNEPIPAADPAALRRAMVSALLLMAGIVGAGGLLYFRAEVWAWATGDLVDFAVVLFMLAVGSLLTIRAGRERQ